MALNRIIRYLNNVPTVLTPKAMVKALMLEGITHFLEITEEIKQRWGVKINRWTVSELMKEIVKEEVERETREGLNGLDNDG